MCTSKIPLWLPHDVNKISNSQQVFEEGVEVKSVTSMKMTFVWTGPEMCS